MTMKMTKIIEDKKDEMTELVEEIRHCVSKLIHCVESLGDEDYGERMGMRDWEEDDDDDMGMRGGRGGGYGMRRGRSVRTGRYTRY